MTQLIEFLLFLLPILAMLTVGAFLADYVLPWVMKKIGHSDW